MKKLRDCPFCGGKAGCVNNVLNDHEGNALWSVMCGECGLVHMGYSLKKEAIGAWNTRANDKDTCDWYAEDEDGSTWGCTECHAIWNLETDSPIENDMHYCPQCGRKIKNVIFREWDSEKGDYVNRVEAVPMRGVKGAGNVLCAESR